MPSRTAVGCCSRAASKSASNSTGPRPCDPAAAAALKDSLILLRGSVTIPNARSMRPKRGTVTATGFNPFARIMSWSCFKFLMMTSGGTCSRRSFVPPRITTCVSGNVRCFPSSVCNIFDIFETGSPATCSLKTVPGAKFNKRASLSV